MGISSLRSLLLAAIFLSNYITWTASRHHYTHNVNGHRSRHRRQGAGLFLPASYIIPGGEGSGAWGEWGTVSACSRTCGGGVASQKRICLEFGSDGQPLCTGGDTKYFSCQTQDCPEGARDFRSEQCASYDNKTFRDQKYNWVPYTKAQNPCELNCMPRGERFYYRQQPKVADGTRCNDESFDVCVDGVCQPVGCDMMLGSNSREDKCRRCRGNGTDCYTTKGILDSQDYRKGYNDILLIPEGATNIFIEEVRDSNNYLALRAKQDNVYYLNGDYHIDFPRRLRIAGALWFYERSQQGLAAPDKLRCLGPILEPLYLSLLLQDDNVGVQYEYSVPSALAPPPSQQYVWVHDEFSPCSATCGGGIQTRTSTCRSREELQEVEEALCDAALRPPTNQSCNTDACAPQWVRGEWGPCSKPCGPDGIRSRQVYCQKIISNGYPSVVADEECSSLLGLKPKPYEQCNTNATCPTWFTEPWKPCDKLCGVGKQKRLVVCHQKINGRVEIYDDATCTEEKPESERSCNLHPCGGVDWVISDWSGCDTCLSTNRTRTAHCATKDYKVVASELCAYHRAPVLIEPCDSAALPPCQYLWYATQWDKCSAECGNGTQTRRVFCGRFDGVTVAAVEDKRCNPDDRYKDTKACSVPKELCPARWFTGPWPECPKKCGGGERKRTLMCISGGRQVLDCDELTVPDSLQSCNTQPCNGDEVLPVDSRSAPIVDDYDEQECDPEAEDYPEENIEIALLVEDEFDESDFTLVPDFITSRATEGSGWETTTNIFDYTDGSGYSYSDETLSTDIDSSTTDSSRSTETISEITGSDVTVTTEIVSTSSTDVTDSESTSVESTLVTEKKYSDMESPETTETGSSGTGITSTDLSTETPASVVLDTSLPDSTETKETDLTISTEGISTDTSIVTESSTYIDYERGSESTTNTDLTISTNYVETTNSESTESESDVTETESTESTVTELTDTTSESSSFVIEGSTTEESTGSTEVAITEETSTTDVSSIGSTETSESSVTESEISTVSTDTSESESTSFTTELSKSEVSTSESDVKESSTTESGSTKSGSTESGSTESGSTESSSTESGSTESGSTESGTTASGTTEAGTTESGTMESGITESGTTESDTTESSTTESGTTESGTAESGTTEASTTESDTTESSTTESGTTESGTAESGTTEASTMESSSSGYSSTESSITESGSTETDLFESSTSVTSESNTSESETTISDTSEASTTESSTSDFSSESSTTPVVSGSSEASPTEMSASSTNEPTESTTVSGETTSSESTYTTESSTLESGSTIEVLTMARAENITPWGWTTVVEPHKKPPCKVRKTKCAKSKFGCCPDKRTPAAGPFDEGCPIPETCAESTYGCCPDGVSAAAGPAARDCPVVPCAVTLYGCCRSDNVTAAEGNDQEGCPEPPPPCFSTKYSCCQDNVTEAKGPEFEGCLQTVTETERPITTVRAGCEVSEFGCCYDNETESSGPDSQGCPCSITEFGCCPDGVSISRGPNLEGCVMTCHTSAYGCCPDGETPAHGPDGEGCCLQAPYGCCPDNYKAAEGPHLEGCGCQYAHFGCCPDNITIARGPNREGCGCQASPNGCCPDRHTAAEGPGYRGCACNTYQFGCCSDGVTAATGPNQQGCICQHSEFGCCGDDITHATGPNMQNCNCASSKYGCCPDGVSEAKGKNFLNCTDLLDNRQAACGLSNDRGSCHNYTVYWFYDVTYGGCSRFWYSGCEGNGNRFVSQAECQDICVHPPPKDVCRLPKVKGACTGYNVRWYYDASREQCSQFVYGGCLGNDNNFETQELCQKRCEPEKTEDQCNLPVEAGPCAGHFPRWGYSGGRCEQFTWGGCAGNANRFGSEAACRLRCAPPGQPIQACSLPQEAGNCTEKHPAWAFSYTESRCVPFYYTGCGGNDNRFDSEQMCSEACPAAHEQEKCTLPAVIGDCAEYSSRWFFDTLVQRCRQFYYGGCGGNENNFVSERECENACMESEEPITLPPTVPSTQPPTQPPTQSPTQPQTPIQIQTTTPGTLPEFCLLDIDQGPCTEMETRWAYDLSRKECVTFEYGGCGGNRNNFPNEEFCSYYCPSRLAPEPEPEPVPVPHIESSSGIYLRFAGDICSLPMISGPCDQSVMQWFYDEARGVCSQFTYSGCEGNDNRFDSQEQCERKCKSPPEINVTSTTTVVPEQIPNECHISNELEECTEQDAVWFFNPRKGECSLFENKNSGRECRHTGTFSSAEKCERSCGAFRGLDVCRYEMDPGPCRAAVPKVYYNSVSRHCEEFTYGGCLGSPNRFSTIEECEQICPPDNLSVDPCTLPPETGNCLASISTWYYDAARGECDVFFYGGCNGNDNRFRSREMCESRCKKASTTTVAFSLSTITTTTTNAPLVTTHETVVEDECSTPASLAPCGDNVTAFYYNSESRACEESLTGACRHPNNYRSEEECQRRCGAFRNLDVCGSPLDAGPCQAAIPKYYWDALSGSCLSFAYGGCDGGPNRFSTIDECEDHCGHTAPAPACLRAVATGDARCGVPAPARRWYYSAGLGDCLPFVFRGCGGSDNSFASYADCAALCIPFVESNEVVPDCSLHAAECAALRCEYGVQRTRTAAGCERCACVPVDVDCAPLRRECERLACLYGIRRSAGTDGCERCTCLEHPCAGVRCAAGQRCVAAPYRDALSADVRYSTDCRTVNKRGVCPAVEESQVAEGQCRHECNDDADCIGVGKCCERGCSSLCLQPAPPTTPAPAPAPSPWPADPNAVRAPELPQAPSAVAALTEPEVRASEGGKATLRCLFHGNPPPTITWRWGAITIESDMGRYRLLTDGSLEIVSLYRNDSGVYICIATNELGRATQEIRLEVDGPVNAKAGIAGEPNAVVMGELGQPLSVRCLSYGFPPPSIYWYHGRDGPMVPYSSPLYEARDNVLQIRKLSLDTLGEYICQAYNGIESPAEWSVTIQALSTNTNEGHPSLLPRFGEGPTTTAEPTTEASTTLEPRIIMRPVFTVPVSTRIVSSRTRVSAGSEINLPCEVDGYPLPAVHWTRDGVPLRNDDRVSVTEARLTILRAQSNDSGIYGCHAANAYSSHYSTIAINVQGLYIPSNCKDNPYFATCHLIVKSKFCHHKYYSGFCCKSCVEAGQLDPNELTMQADMWTWKK